MAIGLFSVIYVFRIPILTKRNWFTPKCWSQEGGSPSGREILFTMVKASEVFPMRTPVKESERLGPEPQDTCFLSQLQSWMYIGYISLDNCPKLQLLYWTAEKVPAKMAMFSRCENSIRLHVMVSVLH